MHNAVVVQVGQALKQLAKHRLDLPRLGIVVRNPRAQRPPSQVGHLDVRAQGVVEHRLHRHDGRVLQLPEQVHLVLKHLARRLVVQGNLLEHAQPAVELDQHHVAPAVVEHGHLFVVPEAAFHHKPGMAESRRQLPLRNAQQLRVVLPGHLRELLVDVVLAGALDGRLLLATCKSKLGHLQLSGSSVVQPLKLHLRVHANHLLLSGEQVSRHLRQLRLQVDALPALPIQKVQLVGHRAAVRQQALGVLHLPAVLHVLAPQVLHEPLGRRHQS
mmetsp:Transcript_11195/g.21114  ORF Transcript_11195/g.21114 Transcript_11195/m.21114 type:complete len:272 (+) Transcript_11195:1787-2602(+)